MRLGDRPWAGHALPLLATAFRVTCLTYEGNGRALSRSPPELLKKTPELVRPYRSPNREVIGPNRRRIASSDMWVAASPSGKKVAATLFAGSETSWTYVFYFSHVWIEN